MITQDVCLGIGIDIAAEKAIVQWLSLANHSLDTYDWPAWLSLPFLAHLSISLSHRTCVVQIFVSPKKTRLQIRASSFGSDAATLTMTV